MALDSSATFEARCLELGLAATFVQELHTGGIDTYASLAFCQPHQANSGIDDVALMRHVSSLVSSALSAHQTTALRRLAFEAQALALQDLRSKLERTSDSEPKVLRLQEKLERSSRLQNRLVGVTFTDHNQPAHALVDKASQQFDEGVLQYLQLNKCISRYQEALAERSSASLRFGSDGAIKVSRESAGGECDISTAHLLRAAFQRRAMAYDIAGVATYEALDAWAQNLFDRLATPVPSSRYSPIGLEQILAADKALWVRLSRLSRGLLGRSDAATGALLVDNLILDLSNHPEVVWHFLPLANASHTPPPKPHAAQPARKRKRSQRRASSAPPAPAASLGRTPAKGPGKGSGAGSRIQVPDGCTIRFSKGPICMKFNLGTCRASHVKPGARCSNGYHTGDFVSPPHAGHPAEQFAARFANSVMTAEQAYQLFELLPAEAPARAASLLPQSKSFTTGAFAYSSGPGLRRHTRVFPLATKALADFVRATCATHSFSSIAIFRDLTAPLHLDALNQPSQPNLLIPLTAFSGGGVWYESPSGTSHRLLDGVVTPGCVLDVASGPVFLPAAEARHQTLPWEGTRCVLVAFTSLDAHTLCPADLDTLSRAGFSCGAPGTPHALPPVPHTSLRPMAVELCAGSASLSAALRAAGFATLAVDHHWNTHSPQHSICQLDLSCPQQQELLLRWMRTQPLAHVHLGLPCGTCSRARERALPHGVPGPAPRPLRNLLHPLGPSVCQANAVYWFALDVLELAASMGATVSLENPSRSWLWSALRVMAEESQRVHLLAQLEECTKILGSPGLFSSLRASCDSSHTHAPWTIDQTGRGPRFATAEEAQYPRLLCLRMAQALATRHQLPEPVPNASASLSQSVRRGPRPLIPEFYECARVPATSTLQPHERVLSSLPSGVSISQDSIPESSSTACVNIGRQWNPQDYLNLAKQTEHPRNPGQVLPTVLKDAVDTVLTTDPVDTAKRRLQAVITIKQLAKELEGKEDEFKSSLDPDVASILSPKKLCLWKALLKASDFDDCGIVDLMARGIPLVGTHGPVPNLEPGGEPSSDSPDNLLASAPLRREAMIQSRKIPSDQHQNDLVSASMEEVSRGDLKGPLTESDAHQHFGSEHWLLNPRFPIYQGVSLKLRVIDDAKASGLNSAFSPSYKVKLMDIDVLACLVAHVASSLHLGHCDGNPVHHLVASSEWEGGTLDLARAYKQVPIDPASRPFCVVGFPTSEGWQYYRSDVLPFGSNASVYAFLKISRALHHVLVKFLAALTTVFYDDFPIIEPAMGAPVLKSAVSAVLDCLGWAHSKDGDKALQFAGSFVALGVLVDLRGIRSAKFRLSNKPGRIDRLVEMIQQFSDEGRVDSGRLSILQGHLNFAAGFYMAKGLRFLSKEFAKLLDGRRSTSEIRALCRLAIALLRGTPEREFDLAVTGQPVIIFTDGSWEGGRAGAGGVVFDPATEATQVFELEVPGELLAAWQQQVGTQLICQIEAYAAISARYLLRHVIRDRLAVMWIDNEPARVALSKGTADSESLRAMARVMQSIEISHPSVLWYERVCSFSNPADMPSRGDAEAAARLFGGRVVNLGSDGPVRDAILLAVRDPYANLVV
ncbi:unnamed protein product [Symbiodinium sp. CCMP2592]|nr:unnamed protein product [Symbiodinium sp. CCMP2592]